VTSIIHDPQFQARAPGFFQVKCGPCLEVPE
jgi:hypothetical protein